MTEKTYSIHLRQTNERIPCTEQEFKDYYRDIDAFRKKQQRHGRCVCPTSKHLDCDMDCYTCPFRRQGDLVSLDVNISKEDGDEITWVDALEDTAPLIEDLVTQKADLDQLFQRIEELMPQALQIGALRQQGMTDTAIAEEIGVGRKTFAHRLMRLREVLEKEYPDFF